MTQLTQESREAIAARKANERFQRESAMHRFERERDRIRERKQRNRIAVGFAMALLGVSAAINAKAPTAKPALILTKSEMSKKELAVLNIAKAPMEKRHALRNR